MSGACHNGTQGNHDPVIPATKFQAVDGSPFAETPCSAFNSKVAGFRIAAASRPE